MKLLEINLSRKNRGNSSFCLFRMKLSFTVFVWNLTALLKLSFFAGEPKFKIIFISQLIKIQPLKNSVPVAQRLHIIYGFGVGQSAAKSMLRELKWTAEHLFLWLRDKKSEYSNTECSDSPHALQCSLFDSSSAPYLG